MFIGVAVLRKRVDEVRWRVFMPLFLSQRLAPPWLAWT